MNCTGVWLLTIWLRLYKWFCQRSLDMTDGGWARAGSAPATAAAPTGHRAEASQAELRQQLDNKPPARRTKYLLLVTSTNVF